MKKSNTSAAKADPAELEFPDWSGMKDSKGRISVEAAFALCEQYPAWLTPEMRRRRQDPSQKCHVEFVL